MGGARQLLVLHGQDHFDHPCDAGCRFQMADVGFNGTHAAIVLLSDRCLLPFSQFLKRLFYPFHFGRIPQFRSGTV